VVKTRFLFLLVLAILAILAYFHFVPSEEKKIKKQFTLLAKEASKEGEENPLAIAQKMNRLRLLFSEKVRLTVPSYDLAGDFTRQDVVNLAARARLSFLSLSLHFYDLHIDLAERQTARVNLTGRLQGKPSRGEPVDEIRELSCLLKKIDDRWLFNKIEVVEVLKK
jgi:hypothetical protein